MSIEVQIPKMAQFQDAFARAPGIVAEELNDAIKRIIFILLADAKKNTPVDMGILRNSFEVDFRTLTGELKNEAPYAIYVHEGTRPHMPPISAVEPWARRHGIPPFLVARSIARKGTKAKPFMKQAVDSNKNEANTIFESAINSILKKISV